MKKELIRKEVDGTRVTVSWKRYYSEEGMKKRRAENPEAEDHYHSEDVYFTTKEAAAEAGKKAVENWGSNLRYLGCSPVEVEGETFFENGFNVWD